MLSDLLNRLDHWKRCFDPARAAELVLLLEEIAGTGCDDPATLIRLHETLLFLRAYPLNAAVARLADRLLSDFASRVGDLDPEPFAAPEVSGIDGTSLTAVFSHEVVRGLAARHPVDVDVAWDCVEESDASGSALSELLPMMAEDWPVEAHVPYERWVAETRPPGLTDLGWLLQRAERAGAHYPAFPVTWNVRGRHSRSRLRLPGRKLFYHREPLIRRADVSIASALDAPPLPVRRLSRDEAQSILDLVLDTSSMRYRELYGFSHPELGAVYHTDPGRGVDFYFWGVPPRHRLPLRAYHCGAFFKNGVPAGYVELLSFFERAEVGFNLYYTFREGESAWLYVQLLCLFHQVLGVECFTVDPYQIGLENDEAIDSGAFWFYRKLGFRPVSPEAAQLLAREEERLRRDPAHRSSKATLRRLARSYLIYEKSAARERQWDRFTIRNLAIALQRDGIPPSARSILAAKRSGEETRYLRLLAANPGLRAQWIARGSAPAPAKIQR